MPYSLLQVESIEGKKEIPVYSVREPSHHQLIAERAVSGAVVIFEAAGVMGFMVAVSSDPTKKDNNSEKFWELKQGRDRSDKVPILMLPEDQDKLVDFEKLHPDFHYLKDPEVRKRFFGTLPFHATLPLRDDAVINKAFVTTPEDSEKKPVDQQVSLPTVCIYFQGRDPVWRHIAQLARDLNPNAHLGISSFNEHKEDPPYNLSQLIDYINRKQEINFNFIVHDPLVEKYDIRSSQTQIQLPHQNESPEIKIFRKGPISADTIEKHTGHTVKVLESAKFASRGHPDNARLDEKVLQYLKEVSS